MCEELREMGLNASMIARELKVTRQAVSRWFCGASSPSARSIDRVAKAMTKLTGKKVCPAQVYNIISRSVERFKKNG